MLRILLRLTLVIPCFIFTAQANCVDLESRANILSDEIISLRANSTISVEEFDSLSIDLSEAVDDIEVDHADVTGFICVLRKLKLDTFETNIEKLYHR